MADITRVLPEWGGDGLILGTFKAATAIAAGQPVVLSGADTVYLADATNTVIADTTGYNGFAAEAASQNQSVMVVGQGATFRGFAAGLTPGQLLYVSASVGELSDVIVNSADDPVVVALNTTDILVTK